MASGVMKSTNKSKSKNSSKSHILKNSEVSTNLSSLANEDSGSGRDFSTDVHLSDVDDTHNTYNVGDLFDTERGRKDTVESETDDHDNDELRQRQVDGGGEKVKHIKTRSEKYTSKDGGLPHHRMTTEHDGHPLQ